MRDRSSGFSCIGLQHVALMLARASRQSWTVHLGCEGRQGTVLIRCTSISRVQHKGNTQFLSTVGSAPDTCRLGQESRAGTHVAEHQKGIERGVTWRRWGGRRYIDGGICSCTLPQHSGICSRCMPARPGAAQQWQAASCWDTMPSTSANNITESACSSRTSSIIRKSAPGGGGGGGGT